MYLFTAAAVLTHTMKCSNQSQFSRWPVGQFGGSRRQIADETFHFIPSLSAHQTDRFTICWGPLDWLGVQWESWLMDTESRKSFHGRLMPHFFLELMEQRMCSDFMWAWCEQLLTKTEIRSALPKESISSVCAREKTKILAHTLWKVLPTSEW